MNFNYPDLQTVSHNGRWYETPSGTYYPSITTILGFTESPEKKASLENWRNSLGHQKAAEVSKKATDHGTNVHLLAERYLKKEQVDAPIDGCPVTLADMNAFKTLKVKLNKIDEVWGQECALYSDDLQVAGRCDLVALYKGVPCIIDFKTAGRVKNHGDILEYKLQLAFYGKAHDEMFGTDIKTGVILMVADSGFPLEFTVNLEDHLPDLRKRANLFWETTINNVK